MKAGSPFPLGATVTANGVNFSIFSSRARAMHLLLFENEDAKTASRVIELAPETNLTGHYWHVEVPDIGAGQIYAYRADGPYAPGAGSRFDGDKVLLDPYGKAVCAKHYDRAMSSQRGDNEAFSMRSVVVNLRSYDWENDQPLSLPFQQMVIYELHVAGFTRHPNSSLPENKRGTYAGLIEKIPYLIELGITAVELMPIFQFDPQDAPVGLQNYWGYSPISFFAPHPGYSSDPSPVACINEFRDMVKALHRAGIEVILDVVYNHTAEGGADGPTLCLKGLDNPMYYILSEDRSSYADFTGTGNTLNVNQSVVRRMITDSLRYWVSEMHVDGFRFDLASVLSRDESGRPIVNAPITWDIDSDPVLAGTKLMAEAWDAGGLYQVGSFSKDRWKEWNGKFRDDVRSFLKSDRGSVMNLKQRLLGSPDIYMEKFHPPEQSINFVTCHDGFTLNDLVSFNEKHNEANGEENRDGTSDNRSWNCGEEGPTENAEIEALRERQIRNAFALNLISIGTPLLLMGDEVRRTQGGNNNPYCQNNETSWFDWDLCSKNAGLRRFVSILIRMRRHFGSLIHQRDLSLRALLEHAEIEWHGVKLFSPDLSDDSHTLAATAYVGGGPAFHLMMNAYWEPLHFAIPTARENARSWFRVVDTFQPSPLDVLESPSETILGCTYLLQPRSIVVLGSLPK
ncbi:glycogen debranching protein GlgX [Terriglobus saanensis]|uniref:Glycogen debranching enzyme GlgX n=1 Tax=Terriglobus saanensis (strain ATCC BAA-1853 / DSM 23119 / SP1PR4) TaxID=401053 RepID=E8V7V6_TERSS|nr:glycogen debranching protein GlgX [Terriglobus saanensis]ADV82880.1 glycogen debranching enzyme GlgX [Terriglobus saanensis SP1PR4]